MRDQYYSPNAAGELALKEAVEMRKTLIAKARTNHFNNIEAKVIEIVRINNLCFWDLKAEFLQSLYGIERKEKVIFECIKA